VRAYDRAWALAPTLPYLAGQRLHAKMKICDWRDLDEGLAAVRDALAAGRPPSALLPLLALPLAPEEQLRAAELYTAAEFPASPAAPAPSPAERIRLAYLSADFHDHATAYLMAELFELHDRARFEVIGISFGPAADSPMRQRLRAAFDRFFDVAPLGAAAIADLVRGLGVDVAVDLKGFTAGARAAVFASRVAPVQVNYLGFPGTMGADFMDYLIADPVLIPPSARGHYAEKIAYVGGCYQPNDRRRPEPTITTSRADHGLPAHGLVFGAFNNAYKILPAVFAAWMRLLADVEGSVLWLFVETPESADNLRAEAARHGVDPGRLVFAGMKPLPGHLERHRHMDLFLDTGPYNAHTTASDALWMDVPLVTWAGETFAGRVAASLLTAVGLPELVAPSFAAYEALALDLARDPARLATLKGRLAMGKRASRLFDTPRLARDLERLYAAMHERRLAGQPPDHIPAAD
jgi:predicted O-linked N-acetylglucosamine transferase (SPINDLY family)